MSTFSNAVRFTFEDRQVLIDRAKEMVTDSPQDLSGVTFVPVLVPTYRLSVSLICLWLLAAHRFGRRYWNLLSTRL